MSGYPSCMLLRSDWSLDTVRFNPSYILKNMRSSFKLGVNLLSTYCPLPQVRKWKLYLIFPVHDMGKEQPPSNALKNFFFYICDGTAGKTLSQKLLDLGVYLPGLYASKDHLTVVCASKMLEQWHHDCLQISEGKGKLALGWEYTHVICVYRTRVIIL